MNLKNAIEQDFSKDWKSVIAAQNDKNKDRACALWLLKHEHRALIFSPRGFCREERGRREAEESPKRGEAERMPQ